MTSELDSKVYWRKGLLVLPKDFKETTNNLLHLNKYFWDLEFLYEDLYQKMFGYFVRSHNNHDMVDYTRRVDEYINYPARVWEAVLKSKYSIKLGGMGIHQRDVCGRRWTSNYINPDIPMVVVDVAVSDLSIFPYGLPSVAIKNYGFSYVKLMHIEDGMPKFYFADITAQSPNKNKNGEIPVEKFFEVKTNKEKYE